MLFSEIRLIDMQGHVVLCNTLETPQFQHTLITSGVPAGLYFLTIYTAERTYTQKISLIPQ